MPTNLDQSRSVEALHFSQCKGKIYLKLDGIEFIFSQRGQSIVVESLEFHELMVRGLLSKDSSISELARLLEPSPTILAIS